jgi:hypothetical protein
MNKARTYPKVSQAHVRRKTINRGSATIMNNISSSLDGTTRECHAEQSTSRPFFYYHERAANITTNLSP